MNLADFQNFVGKGMAAQAAVDKLTDAHCRDCGFILAGGASVGSCPKCGSREWFKGRPRETVQATPLLCRSKVREFLLEAGKQHRPFNKFSRVSEDTLLAANAALRAWCVSRVKSAPSKGVTL